MQSCLCIYVDSWYWPDGVLATRTVNIMCKYVSCLLIAHDLIGTPLQISIGLHVRPQNFHIPTLVTREKVQETEDILHFRRQGCLWDRWSDRNNTASSFNFSSFPYPRAHYMVDTRFQIGMSCGYCPCGICFVVADICKPWQTLYERNVPGCLKR